MSMESISSTAGSMGGSSGSLAGLAQTGLSFLSKKQSNKNSDAEVNAIRKEGEIAARNKARETNLKAASATVSFLNSGLTLEGTPMANIQGIYAVGLEDVNQIIENTNAKASNIYTQARSAYIKQQAKDTNNFGLGGLDILGMFGGDDDSSSGSSLVGASSFSPSSWGPMGTPGSATNPITWND